MVTENPEKHSLYTVFDGDLEHLSEKVTSYCTERYGDRCEFKKVSIERVHPDGQSWKVHDFPSFDERAVNAIRNHLKTRMDAIHVRFGDSLEDETLELIICRARNTSKLARHIKKKHLQSFEEDDLVVLAVEKEDESQDVARQLLESLEK